MPRAFDARGEPILMRRRSERRLEHANEVERRQPGASRDEPHRALGVLELVSSAGESPADVVVESHAARIERSRLPAFP